MKKLYVKNSFIRFSKCPNLITLVLQREDAIKKPKYLMRVTSILRKSISKVRRDVYFFRLFNGNLIHQMELVFELDWTIIDFFCEYQNL
jgi:hypothetical protein